MVALLLTHAQRSFLEANTMCNTSAVRAGWADPAAQGHAADLTGSDPTAWCGSLSGTSWSRAACAFFAQILNMACAVLHDGKSILLKYLIKRVCAEEAGSWAKEGVVHWKMPILHSRMCKELWVVSCDQTAVMLMFPSSFRHNFSQRRQLDCLPGTGSLNSP